MRQRSRVEAPSSLHALQGAYRYQTWNKQTTTLYPESFAPVPSTNSDELLSVPMLGQYGGRDLSPFSRPPHPVSRTVRGCQPPTKAIPVHGRNSTLLYWRRDPAVCSELWSSPLCHHHTLAPNFCDPGWRRVLCSRGISWLVTAI